MSDTKKEALSLVDEFHKAQYLDDVPKEKLKKLANMLADELSEEDAEDVLKILSKVDPETDLSTLDLLAPDSNGQLTQAEEIRLLFWTLRLWAALVEDEAAPDLTVEESKEIKKEMDAVEKELREDIEKADPDFARYIFGPS